MPEFSIEIESQKGLDTFSASSKRPEMPAQTIIPSKKTNHNLWRKKNIPLKNQIKSISIYQPTLQKTSEGKLTSKEINQTQESTSNKQTQTSKSEEGKSPQRNNKIT